MRKVEYKTMFAIENEHWWFLAKRIFVNSLINNNSFLSKNELKILDLGCGTGGMTKNLEKFGQVLGVEQNRIALALCKKRNIKVISGSVEKITIKNKKFDLITLFDVLYHQNVKESLVLKEVFRLLKKNGYLLLTDCALPFFWSIHDEQMMAKKRFTKRELENMLKNNNFSIIKSSYIYFFTFPAFVIQRFFLRFNKIQSKTVISKLPNFLNSTFLFLEKIEAFLLCYIKSWPIGSSIIILAKKND